MWKLIMCGCTDGKLNSKPSIHVDESDGEGGNIVLQKLVGYDEE